MELRRGLEGCSPMPSKKMFLMAIFAGFLGRGGNGGRGDKEGSTHTQLPQQQEEPLNHPTSVVQQHRCLQMQHCPCLSSLPLAPSLAPSIPVVPAGIMVIIHPRKQVAALGRVGANGWEHAPLLIPGAHVAQEGTILRHQQLVRAQQAFVCVWGGGGTQGSGSKSRGVYVCSGSWLSAQ